MDTRAVGLLIDPDSGAIVDANRMAVRYYGYSLEQLQQLKITDINILPPEEIAAEIRRACTEQATVSSSGTGWPPEKSAMLKCIPGRSI